jgi:uncharacterized protein (DUF362 family)
LEKVVVADVSGRLLVEAIEEIFDAFGGIRVALPAKEQVFIKPNASGFAPYSHTSPQVLSAVLGYLRDHGYRRLRVMDSSSQGLFTRLVFKTVGYDAVCRRFGATPVYLDERKTIAVALDGGSAPVNVPRIVYEELIVAQARNSYLSIPKLKLHPTTTVSLNLKGQQAFVSGPDRGRDHNHRLHQHVASLYRLVQPDFCIVDGLQTLVPDADGATPLRGADEQVVDLGILIGGANALAVDAVGARILGYAPDEVAHLRLATDWTPAAANAEVIGDLSRFRERHDHVSIASLPAGIDIVEGQEQACPEGCQGSVLRAIQVLHRDFQGRGQFTVVCGKGIDPARLDGLRGEILIVGPCAASETTALLRERYPDRPIHVIDAHADLAEVFRQLCRLMGVQPRRLVPLPRVQVAWLWLLARLNGLEADVPFFLRG